MLDLLSHFNIAYQKLLVVAGRVDTKSSSRQQQHTQVLDCHQSCRKLMTKSNTIGV